MAFHWIGKSEDGKSVTLKHLEECNLPQLPYINPEWMTKNTDLIRIGLALDVETTGLSHQDDVVIEVAARQFLFNKDTGDIISLGKSYTAFQDPGRPLSKEISDLTGITDEMLAGKKIDWDLFDTLLSESAIIIAHNARFDRPFIDKKSKHSKDKIWACTIKQINWPKKGFFSSKLELLNIYHGFFTDSHRALNDVSALLNLLTFKDTGTNRPYLFELTSNAKRPMNQVVATSAPFETKDLLKNRGYNWDNGNRVWAKTIYRDEVPTEIIWLEENVYFGPFRGLTREFALSDNFKN